MNPAGSTANPLIFRIELTRLVERLRSDVRSSEWARTTFLSDPGGYLDYVGAMDSSPLPQVSRDVVARDAIDLLFAELGATLP